MQLKIGDSYKNNNPYEGEGELIIASEPDESNCVKCIHALHVKHKALNGVVEIKSVDAILEFYHKVDDGKNIEK